MTRNLGILAVLGLFMTTACGSANQVIIGGHARPQTFHNIVSLSPSTTELFLYAGQINDLRGRTSSDDFPVTVKNIPIVAKVKPDYEAIAALKPDLVLADRQLYSPSDLAKIQELGAKVFIWDPLTISDYEKQLIALAELIGNESQVSTYIDKIKQAQENAVSAAHGQHLSVALISPDPSGHDLWCGTGSFQADELKAAQLTLVGPGGSNFVPLDAEALIKADPDFILLIGPEYQSFVKDPRFQGLKALKAGHAIDMSENLAYRRGSRVDSFIDHVSRLVYGGAQ